MLNRAQTSGPKRLTQAEVDAVCARHERLWSARPGGARAVFAWMDLSGLDLSGRNLADADLSGAVLVGCNLSNTRLDNANLFGADAREVNLSGASLRRTDLRGACLRGADLSGADLFEADLREGTLAAADSENGFRVVKPVARASDAKGVSLVGANLERSKLTGVIAVRADFTDAVMRDCKLVRANLKQATLNGADLAGSDLSGADLSGADLTDAVLVGVRKEAWKTDGADLKGALTDDRSGQPNVSPQVAAERLGEHARWCETSGAEGKPSVFDDLDLRLLESVRGFNLTALSARRAIFYGLDMEGVQLQGARLEGADLRACKLRGADLRGARLAGARLNGADLREAHLGPLVIGQDRLLPADLTGAVLRGADLSGADLRHATLAEADLRRARLLGAQTLHTDFTLALFEGAVGVEDILGGDDR